MKKILGLLMLLGLFAFTACGNKGGENTEAATGETPTEQPADHSMDAGHGSTPAPTDTTATQTAPAGDQAAPAGGGTGKSGGH